MAGLFRYRPDSVPHSDKPDAAPQSYDDARGADERRGSIKRGSYLAKRRAKRVEPDVEPIPLEAELTQVSTILPDEEDEAKG